MNTSPNINFNPIISSIQKVAIYETKHKLYLIGSNYKESRFRILEIDRTCVEELRIYENPKEFDNREIRQFVNKIRYTKCLGAYGVLGFVRFLEGYYIVLITKRIRCAAIGMHTIYTVKDTIMIRIADSSVPRTLHQHEARYVKMFCNIDLKSNFYFCYSYDLTRSLQHNMSGPKYVGSDVDVETEEPLPDWTQMNLVPTGQPQQKIEFAFRSVSRKRFVWNEFLLQPLQHIHHRDWCLEVITGFVSQSTINIYGRPIYVCLVARRSTKFAGTRFLKRGANRNGDVANEVETEQIVTDGNRMCSFVQMRGSIPSHWSQDTSKIVSKPPISLDLPDPYAETAAKHFERLLYDFGAPVIVFNLVKKREKRKHESILTQDMLTSIKYLNQFVPLPFKIKYIHFDMARKSRGERIIMPDLARIAESIVQSTGMYLHDPQGSTGQRNRFQTGLVRVNCVDCLDRTNTAQFAIGKCVLAHQLHQLGFINPPVLEFDSDCVTMLESLYEDHGDTLALQYGGSQLVHRIKSYRKTAAWSSQGNDIMQTMSRYVSNKFSDAEKQHSINLFLGYFVPYENKNRNLAIWDLPSDYYMHNLHVTTGKGEDEVSRKTLTPITDWIRPIVLQMLPNSTSDSCKIVSEFIRVQSHHVEMVDCYANYYIPNRYTPFEEQIAYQIKLLASPNFRMNPYNDYSPFVPRKREVVTTNPSLTGQSSTSSATGSTESSCDENPSSDEETQLVEMFSVVPFQTVRKGITFASVLGSMQDVYGMDLKRPVKESQRIFRTYVQVGRMAKVVEEKTKQTDGSQIHSSAATIKSRFKPKDFAKLLEPTVSAVDMDKYSRYLQVPERFSTNTLDINHDLLQRYINVEVV